MKESLNVKFSTRVTISEHELDGDGNPMEVGNILLDRPNAIHSQNMARAIARSLAREPNGFIHRIAFGNGGSFTDAGETTVINPPNDGTRGDGWESRLYNETYSEIVDEENPLVGTDPGSAGPNSTRIGGGAVPSDDPEDNKVTSQEVGRKSNVTATMYINKSEPLSQLIDTTIDGEIVEEEKTFEFDELGFYTTGNPASPQPARSTVDVGNKTSEDFIPSAMFNGTYTLSFERNGVSRNTQVTIPATGSGPSGEVTFGDLCEGLNSGSWVSGGDDVSVLLNVSITDRTVGAVYPTISGEETFGFLVFENGQAEEGKTLQLECTSFSADFLYNLTSSNCSKVDTGLNDGTDAGVANDAANPENERERLLTHITFSPILKKENRVLKIVYTLTVSTSQTGDCAANIALPSPTPSNTPVPTPTPTTTPTPTPSNTPVPTPTPTTTPTPTPTPTPSAASLVWAGTTSDWAAVTGDGAQFNVSYDGTCFDIGGISFGSSDPIGYNSTISPVYGLRFNLTLSGSATDTDVSIAISTNAGSTSTTVNITNGVQFLYELDETSGIFDGVSALEPATITVTSTTIGSYDVIDLCDIEVLTLA